VEVIGLGALSDALVCRRRWDSIQVLRDRDVLLGADRGKALEYVAEWRENAVEMAVEAFALVKEAEMKGFGDKSYFFYKERLDRLGIPMPVLGAELDQGGANGGDDGGDLGFAEEGEQGEKPFPLSGKRNDSGVEMGEVDAMEVDDKTSEEE
jgi:hypothetical protein